MQTTTTRPMGFYKPANEILSFIFGLPADSPRFTYLSPSVLKSWCMAKGIPLVINRNQFFVAGWQMPIYNGYVARTGLARYSQD